MARLDLDLSHPVLSEPKMSKNLELLRGYDYTVDAIATTGGRIPEFGVTSLSSTGAAGYVIGPPVVGVRKFIIQTGNTTATKTVTTSSTGITYNGTNTILTFNALGDSIELVGLSDTRYGVVNNTSVDLS